MNNLQTDPDGYCPGDVVKRLIRCISSGTDGIDYTVIPREKNEELRRKYCITSAKIRDILLSLTEDDYIRWEPSNSVKFSDIVHFFEKRVLLIPRYVEDAKEVPVDLYIKVAWNKGQNNYLFIISFHEKEY